MVSNFFLKLCQFSTRLRLTAPTRHQNVKYGRCQFSQFYEQLSILVFQFSFCSHFVIVLPYFSSLFSLIAKKVLVEVIRQLQVNQYHHTSLLKHFQSTSKVSTNFWAVMEFSYKAFIYCSAIPQCGSRSG